LAPSPASIVQGDPSNYSAWSAPIYLGPAVNYPGKSDLQPCVTKDGLSLFFATFRPGGLGNSDIWVSQRASVDDPWGEPENLGPSINSPFNDWGPALSPDEHTLYFGSARPGGQGGNDIYVARRHDRRDDFGWTPALNVGAPVNTAAEENNPALVDEALYFQSDRFGGMDIFTSTRQEDGMFGEPVLFASVSSSGNDQGPFASRNGLELYVTSTRPGGFGGQDLWVSTRASTSDPWPEPVNLGSVVNSVADEAQPSLSFDGTELYFTSTRLGGPAPQDLWMCLRTKLRGGLAGAR
jgi:Tol biopolymer transport system component